MNLFFLFYQANSSASATYYDRPEAGTIKFILPEFVSYSGKRGVLCVGNGWHFCTPVLMSMSNITFQVMMLSTYVFSKCSEISFTNIFVVKSKGFGWHNVGPASQVAQHYFTIWPMYLGKWNESGFRPLLCTYRLNWARRTSWGWWDDWDDTVFQTQDSKFEPWRSEAEHATFWSRRLPTILTFPHGWGRNIFCFFQTAETGNRTPNCVKGSGANHYPRAPASIWVAAFLTTGGVIVTPKTIAAR